MKTKDNVNNGVVLVDFFSILRDVQRNDLRTESQALLLQIMTLYQKYGFPERGIDLSEEEIKCLIHKSENVVRRAKQELEELHFITVKRGSKNAGKSTIKLNERYTKRKKEKEKENQKTTVIEERSKSFDDLWS